MVLRGRCLWPIAVLPVILLTACGGGSTRPPRTVEQPPVRFTQADQGRVLTLGLGRRAVVRLDKPEWAFRAVSGRSVRALGPGRLVLQVKGCRTLPACGYVTLPIQAVARGRSVIVATRGICGEDYRCPPSQRTLTLTIAVR